MPPVAVTGVTPVVAEFAYSTTVVPVACNTIELGSATLKLIYCVDVCPVTLSVTTNAYVAVVEVDEGVPDITPGVTSCMLGYSGRAGIVE